MPVVDFSGVEDILGGGTVVDFGDVEDLLGPQAVPQVAAQRSPQRVVVQTRPFATAARSSTATGTVAPTEPSLLEQTVRQFAAGTLDIGVAAAGTVEAAGVRQTQREAMTPEQQTEADIAELRRPLGIGGVALESTVGQVTGPLSAVARDIVDLIGPERVMRLGGGAREFLQEVQRTVEGQQIPEELTKEFADEKTLLDKASNPRWWLLRGARIAGPAAAWLLANRAGVKLATGTAAQRVLGPQDLVAAGTAAGLISAAGVSAVLEGGLHYADRLAEGIAPEKAAEESAQVAEMSALITAVTTGPAIARSGLVRGVASKVAAVAAEPLEESLQAISQNIVAGRDPLHGVGEAALLALPFGAAEVAGMAGQRGRVERERTAQQRPLVERFVGSIDKAAEQGTESLARTVEAIRAAREARQEEVREGVMQARQSIYERVFSLEPGSPYHDKLVQRAVATGADEAVVRDMAPAQLEDAVVRGLGIGQAVKAPEVREQRRAAAEEALEPVAASAAPPLPFLPQRQEVAQPEPILSERSKTLPPQVAAEQLPPAEAKISATAAEVAAAPEAAPSNIYLRMPIERVRQDAAQGVTAAREALRIRAKGSKGRSPEALFIVDPTLNEISDAVGRALSGKRDVDPTTMPNYARAQAIVTSGEEAARRKLSLIDKLEDPTVFEKAIFEAVTPPPAMGFLTSPIKSIKRIDAVTAKYTYEQQKALDVFVRTAEDLTGTKLPVERNPYDRATLFRGWEGVAEVQSRIWGEAAKTAGKSGKSLTRQEQSDLSNHLFLKGVIQRESKARARNQQLNDLIAERTALTARVRRAKGGEATRLRKERDALRRNIEQMREIAQEGEFDPARVNPGAFTADQASVALEEFKGQNPQEFARLEEASKNLAEYWGDMLDYLSDAGIVSVDQWAALRESGDIHGEYLGPFDVVEYWSERKEKIETVGRKALNVSDQKIIQAMRGTNKDVRNLLEASIDKTFAAISLAERNKAVRELWRMRDMAPEMKDVVREMKEGQEPPTGYGVVSFLDDGQVVRMAVPQPVADAMTKFNRPQTGILARAMQAQSRALRTGATALSATFAVRNIPRDYMTQFFAAENPLVPWAPKDYVLIVDSFFTALLKQDSKLMRDYKRFGAAYGSELSSLREPERRVRRIVGNDITESVLHPLDTAREVMLAFASVTEQATRLALFRKQRAAAEQAGARPEAAGTQAALAGRRGTIDFARGGEITLFLNWMSPFVNAAVQGTRTLGRGILKNPTRAAAAASTAMLTQLLMSMHDREKYGEVYDKVDEETRRKNWVKIVGVGTNQDTGEPDPIIVTFPKGDVFEVATRPVEDYVAWLYRGDADVKGDVLGIINDVSPFEFVRDGKFEPGLLATRFLPPGVKGIMEAYANKNFYFDTELESAGMRQRLPTQRYRASTSLGARRLSEWSAAIRGKENAYSPVDIDNFARSVGGEFGVTLLKLPEIGKSVEDIPGRRELRFRDVDITNDLFGIPLNDILKPLNLPLKDLPRLNSVPGVKALISTRGTEQTEKMHGALDVTEMQFGSEAFLRQQHIRDFLNRVREGKVDDAGYDAFFAGLDLKDAETLKREMQKVTGGFGPGQSVMARLRSFGVDSGERAIGIVRIFNETLPFAEDRQLFLARLATTRPPILNETVMAQLYVLQRRGKIKAARKRKNQKVSLFPPDREKP